MVQTTQCPACGEAVAHGAHQCPHCKLKGLDQIFLSREDYDNWVNTVLKPHAGRFSRRVISGGGATLLILTGAGELYGMGRNYSGQLLEDGEDIICEPVHMASGVISAAISGYYSIFATEDGRIHIRGRGEFSERVPEFTDAREVFVDESQFFVVNSRGQVFCFGNNTDGFLQPVQEEVLAVFPKKSVTKGPFYDSNAPFCYGTRYPSRSDAEAAEWEVRCAITETEEYQRFAAQYDAENLHICLNPTSPSVTDIEYVHYNSYKKYNLEYQYAPKLVWRNSCLYTPILYHDQSFADTPHRCHGLPLDPADRPMFESDTQFKKVCTDFRHSNKNAVALCHDGTLIWFDYEEVPHRLEWPHAPVFDVTIGPYVTDITVSCQDGKLYQLDTSPLPAVKITREIEIK